MRPATATDMSRVAQLTQKTNQFNLSLKRRSEAEVCSLSLDHSIYVVEVTDRFGDYGLVGVCILMCPPERPETVEIDSLLISCRALGRGVEEAMLYGILNHAKSRSCRTLEAEMISGLRNQPVAEFLQRSGFEQIDGSRFVRSSETSVMIPSRIAWTGP
jgi:FkbH-like protein